MTKRRSAFQGKEQWVDLHGPSAARQLRDSVVKLRALEAGTDRPAHEQDTVEHRRGVVRAWISAFRTVGSCKRCGRPLDGDSPQAALNRLRGIGPDCWEKKLSDAERDDITDWVEHQRATGEPT